MKTKRILRTGLMFLVLVGVGILFHSGFTSFSKEALTRQLEEEPLNLPVEPIQQLRATSCGEAAITMTYNYVFSETHIQEADVITYAAANGYFTEDFEPFTSPAAMVKIARHYADDVSTGRVYAPEQGLALLVERLQNDEPVIIDVLTRLDDPSASAHFVIVTGASVDPDQEGVIIIHYNDPLTGLNDSAHWEGEGGIWNAWQGNSDPGGSGWWMVIHRP